MYSRRAMMLGLAIALWLAMVVSGVAMLCAAISAGRSQRVWQRFPLLAVEMLLLGAAGVLWMLDMWFIAKTLMAIGMSATTALLLAIAIGIALVGLAVYACLRLVRTVYSVLGMRARYAMDVGNSLWFGRGGTFRPRDFRA